MPSRVVAENGHAFAIRDSFPVTPGHSLVIPRRHVADWWRATPAERLAMDELVVGVKAGLDEEFGPAGYNVGFNEGAAAGQTVFHLHVHVIPRYQGDVEDPRGGVRHVIPGRGNYHAIGTSPADPESPVETGFEQVMDPSALIQRVLAVLPIEVGDGPRW